ncbi:MAG: FAD-binding domain-containing protein [Bacteroidota bacterium]|nr:FAD-binding domain-containing protein [Bacteroidota bacterium]
MTTIYSDILEKLAKIRPMEYAKSRNFLDGAVTYLSPYISRGVLSTKQVYDSCMDRGFKPYRIEKFIQELAWRDYWQRIWQEKDINIAIKQTQQEVDNFGISKQIVDAKSGIIAIDQAINTLYDTGYMHNHLRMYVAALACNIAKSHWKVPAQWMYYHLIDGDWGSNALSWQWVCGANSRKKYIANQENINKYTRSQQRHSFLDTDYESLSQLPTPNHLHDIHEGQWVTPLPQTPAIQLDQSLPLCIYTYYNLDPMWRKDEACQRVLLLEPSVFKTYPIGQRPLDFMLSLAQNIDDIQIYVGEFSELTEGFNNTIYFKEHPLNTHFEGLQDQRDWLTSVQGYYPSFFAFWKRAKKELNIK